MNWRFWEKSTPAAEDLERAVINNTLPLPQGQTIEAPQSRTGWPAALDYPWAYYMTFTPKKLPGKPFNVETLRSWADQWDPLRSVIEYLKAELASIPIQIIAKDGAKRDVPPDLALWLDEDGPLGGIGETRRVFESKIFEDVLVVGQYATWYLIDRRARPLECYAIDAGTIKPAIDELGWPRTDFQYEQWLMGVKYGMFTRAELRLDGLCSRTHSPYFVSPVEWAIRLIFMGQHMDAWNTGWLTEGQLRAGDVITLPEEWSPDQVQEFTRWWQEKGKNFATKFLPSGSTKISDHTRVESDFQEFEVQTIRRLCSLFGIQPASIGYVGEQYKVTQGDSMDHSRRVGVGRLLRLRKEFYDDLLRRLGYAEFEVVDADDDLDAKSKAVDIAVKECGGAYKTRNEVRAEQGLDPIDGADEIEGVAEEDPAQQP